MRSKKGKQENFLEAVPAKNVQITTLEENELAVISFPKFKSKFWARLFIPKNKENIIKIRLDEHGTKVWHLIDGEKNVEAICKELYDHFNGEANYEYRIASFIAQLHKSGFVTISKNKA